MNKLSSIFFFLAFATVSPMRNYGGGVNFNPGRVGGLPPVQNKGGRPLVQVQKQTIKDELIIDKYEELCTTQSTYSKSFKELPGKTSIEWNVKSAFASGRKLGSGSFGEVRKVTYKGSDGREIRIAMKMVRPENSKEHEATKVELSALAALGNSKYAPRLYGCTLENGYIFIAQTFLHHSLEAPEFTDNVKIQTCAQSLILYKDMFNGLKDLWAAGFVHNDIKPANMMTDEKNTRSYLIDLGLAQRVGSKNKAMGTPYFMSPAKWSQSGQVAQKDDMYSVALSIVFVEAKRGYDELFGGFGLNLYSCFRTTNNINCRKKLIANATPILQKAGYGSVQATPSKSTINFTTLILSIIEYDHFTYSLDDVVEIIDRLIREDPETKKKILELEEAKKVQEELEKARELQMNLKAINQKEKALKGEIIKQELGKVVLQKVNGENKEAQQRMRERMDAKQNELELLNVKKAEKAKEFEQFQHRNRESSQVYKENPDLFKRKEIIDEEEFVPAGIKDVDHELPDLFKKKERSSERIKRLHSKIYNGEDLSEDEMDFLFVNHVAGTKIPYFIGINKKINQFGLLPDVIDYSGPYKFNQNDLGSGERKKGEKLVGMTPKDDNALNLPLLNPKKLEQQKRERDVRFSPYVDNSVLPKVNPNRGVDKPLQYGKKMEEGLKFPDYQPLRNNKKKNNFVV